MSFPDVVLSSCPGPVPDPIGDDPGIHQKKNIFDQ
jgi:hypothetical protein